MSRDCCVHASSIYLKASVLVSACRMWQAAYFAQSVRFWRTTYFYINLTWKQQSHLGLWPTISVCRVNFMFLLSFLIILINFRLSFSFLNFSTLPFFFFSPRIYFLISYYFFSFLCSDPLLFLGILIFHKKATLFKT